MSAVEIATVVAAAAAVPDIKALSATTTVVKETPPFGALSTAEDVVDAFASNVRGRTFFITGASAGGLGAYYATALARAGPAHLILLARSEAKVVPVLAAISAANPAVRTTFVCCDLADQASVRAAAGTVLADPAIDKIDVLINNAGVMAIPNCTLDSAGNEMTFSANHLGHFLLTNLLLPKVLAAGEGACIVNLTSHGHRLSDVWWSDPTFGNGRDYDRWSAYGQSKTAAIQFSVELAKRLQSRGIASIAVNPGTVMGTSLSKNIDLANLEAEFEPTNRVALRNTGRPFGIDQPFKTLSQGASSPLAAALDPALAAAARGGSAYVQNCQVDEPYEYALDPVKAGKLWALSEEIIGQKFSF